MERRRGELMQIQQQIAFEYNQALVGQVVDVIIDAPHPEQKGVWMGRTKADAPDVDSIVYVTETDHRLQAGQIVSAEVVDFVEYDLVAAAVGKPTARKALNVLS
jgi:ribosomal protein S12 methylthiotransferase